MSYRDAEQFERWHQRTCARCARFGCFAARWPDGHVCRTCHDKALTVRGCCPGCGQDRILPGRRDATAVCTECAGFTYSYACSRCGTEGKLHGGRRCSRCTLSDRVTEVLDDGTGRIRSQLEPLAAALTGMDRALSGLVWLHTPAAVGLLHSLGRGEIELTHAAFHLLQPWRAASHLRELLMACGLLPAVDRYVLLFERWLLVDHLPGIADPGHAQIIRRFATWQVLAGLHRRAASKPLTSASRRFAGEQVTGAARFLTWLAARGQTLGTCTQADIDTWHVEHTSHHNVLRAFFAWSATNKLTRRFELPRIQIRGAAPLTQHRRLTMLRRLLTCDEGPRHARVAAILLLLYAQPVSRIVRLTVDDVVRDNDQVSVRLGAPLSPVPQPFAALLLEHADHRANMRTAANHASRWLFPGRGAGQPLRAETLAGAIHELGVPAAAGRGAAIRQLVLQAPAPVVAQALGYHDKTTSRLVTEAGGTWSRYAGGDHSR